MISVYDDKKGRPQSFEAKLDNSNSMVMAKRNFCAEFDAIGYGATEDEALENLINALTTLAERASVQAILVKEYRDSVKTKGVTCGD